MSVTVDKGQPDPAVPVREYEPSRWPEIVRLRRDFIKREITKDCRYLSRFVAEANEIYKACGYSSVEELLRKGYEVDPEEMKLAVAWLDRNDPTEAMPLRTVLELAQHGGDRRSDKAKAENQPAHSRLKYGTTNRDYILARLKRDGHADLHRAVVDGELSARAAAIEAGFLRKTITVPIDTVENALRPLVKRFGLAKLEKLQS